MRQRDPAGGQYQNAPVAASEDGRVLDETAHQSSLMHAPHDQKASHDKADDAKYKKDSGDNQPQNARLIFHPGGLALLGIHKTGDLGFEGVIDRFFIF